MNKLLIIVFALSIIFSCNGSANFSNTKNKYLNIRYAKQSDAQKLDIYLPDEENDSFPVILAIHGGGWSGGDKRSRQLNPMLEGLKKGYSVISINYRLSGEAIWPAQIYDCKAAVRWVKANAEKYNLNPEKIVAWGGSAGGHLAAMLGTSANIKSLENLSQGNATQSSRVAAVVDWFGPINFLKMDDQFKESGIGKPNHNEANSPESRLLGQQITKIPAKVKQANPTTYISSDDPPILIQHGTMDKLVPTQQSENFYTKLKEILGEKKVSLKLIEGAGHGTREFRTSKNLEKVFEFLDRKLR